MQFSQFKDILAKFTFILTIVSIISFIIFFDRIKISLSLVFTIIFCLILINLSLLVFFRTNKETGKCSDFKLKGWAPYLLLALVISFQFGSFFADLFISNGIYYSNYTLFFGLLIAVLLTKHSCKLALFCLLFIMLSYVIMIYLFYPPTLGIWRDCNAAIITMKTGIIGGIEHNAYAIAILPTLYSIVSLVLNISPVYSCALFGIIYLSIIIILTYLISSKLTTYVNDVSSFLSILLILSIPVIILWSVAFTPEAYAFLLFLTLLSLIISARNDTKNVIILVLPLLVMIVFGHGGTSLWSIGFFISLTLMMFLTGKRFVRFYSLIKKILLILVLITLAYFIYTSLLFQISSNLEKVFSVVFSGLTLTSISPAITVSDSAPFATALLNYGPLAICVAMSLIAWLGNKRVSNIKGALIESSFLYSLLTLFIAFLGVIYLPNAILDRYLGFGALLVLSILSPIGFNHLFKKGRAGRTIISFLLLLLILCASFGATLNNDSNLFGNKTAYSVVYPSNWNNKVGIETVVSNIDNGVIIADRFTGNFLFHSFLNKYIMDLESDSIEGTILNTPEGSITINYLGSEFLKSVTYDYVDRHIHGGDILVYRAESFDKLTLLKDVTESEMYIMLLNNCSKVYSGPVEVLLR